MDKEINDLVRTTATKTSSPDSLVGYGVARFDLAYTLQQHIVSSPSTPKIIKIDANQIILYTAGMNSLDITLSKRRKFLGLFHINKTLMKERIVAERNIEIIPLNEYNIKCTQKHTIKVKLKSDVETYELKDNELYPCKH